METKLIAAELATGAGVATVICHSGKPSNIFDIITAAQPVSTAQSAEVVLALSDNAASNLPLHTLFTPTHHPLPDRRWWILHGLSPRGRIVIDEGAYRAVFKRSSVNAVETEGNGGRLLAAGVVAVEGTFAAGQAVRIAVRRKPRSADSQGQGRAAGTASLDSSVEDLAKVALDSAEAEEIVEVGRGLANYNWQEMDRLKGLKRCSPFSDLLGSRKQTDAPTHSSEIEATIGYLESEHVVEAITISSAR